MNLTYFSFMLLLISLTSCNHKGNDINALNQSVDGDHETAIVLEQNTDPEYPKLDTMVLQETFQQDDVPLNEYLMDSLEPIRKNFRNINFTTEWTSVDKIDLLEPTEGGEVSFYYSNKSLKKITTKVFGETAQQLTEYYLLDGELSFVFEKSYTYNRPIYWDSTRMQENGDDQAFDFDLSEITEDRSYFKNGKLIHKIESADCGAPFGAEYLLKEQNRLTENFGQLLVLAKVG